MGINWDQIIEYKSYPRGMGFYSRKFNKIFINPIVLNYPTFHKYMLEHEKSHYMIYNKYNNPILLLILNVLLEWYTVFLWSIKSGVLVESTKCLSDFSKITFSKEEIESFNSQFLSQYLSIGWLNQKLMDYLRPDDYGMVLLITSIFFVVKPEILAFIIINSIAFLLIRLIKRKMRLT